MLDQLSALRTTAVLEIPLDEALDRLKRLAIGAEIRYSNHVLRVIHEFERAPASAVEELPPFVDVVDPNVPDAYRLHFVDPRTEERKTFCGVSYAGWKRLDRVSTRAAIAERHDICRRCRRSLELARDAATHIRPKSA